VILCIIIIIGTTDGTELTFRPEKAALIQKLICVAPQLYKEPFIRLSSTSIENFGLLQWTIVQITCSTGTVVEHAVDCTSYVINADCCHGVRTLLWPTREAVRNYKGYLMLPKRKKFMGDCYQVNLTSMSVCQSFKTEPVRHNNLSRNIVTDTESPVSCVES